MKKIILAGPFVGEFGWEVLRFAPHVLWLKHRKHRNEVGLVVYTRPDRFDLYGKHTDEFVPLDMDNKRTDCFKSLDMTVAEYGKLASRFFGKYRSKYKIVEHIYPQIRKKEYTEKQQFPKNEMLYNFKPRPENKNIVDHYIPDDKPLIALGPRFRKMASFRNWKHWETFYNYIEQIKEFNFVICGKEPEYVPDPKNRYFDVNQFPIVEGTSMVGILIEVLKRSVLCVGSQSGIPNLSNLVGTPTLQWGNEKKAHAKTYNVKNTPTLFIEDNKFEVKPEEVLIQMKNLLKGVR